MCENNKNLAELKKNKFHVRVNLIILYFFKTKFLTHVHISERDPLLIRSMEERQRTSEAEQKRYEKTNHSFDSELA